MKKLFLLSACLFGIFGISQGYSQCSAQGCGAGPAYGQGYGRSGVYQGYGRGSNFGGYGRGAVYQGGDCREQPTGQCYCQYVRYEPRPYTTTRCVEERYNCPKTCCRMVPEYFQVQKCRYVPEYYCETRCKQVPQYYEVQECKTRYKTICEPQCDYVPKYYWRCENKPCCP